jgi:hypothetical protein
MKSGARIGIEALLLLSDLEKVKHHGKKWYLDVNHILLAGFLAQKIGNNSPNFSLGQKTCGGEVALCNVTIFECMCFGSELSITWLSYSWCRNLGCEQKKIVLGSFSLCRIPS